MKMQPIFKLIFISLFFAACKKNNSDQEVYYMSANVNGIGSEFNLGAHAGTFSDTTFALTTIAGLQSTTNNMIVFNFISYTTDQLVPGTYTGRNSYELSGVYKKSSSNKQYTNIGLSNFTVVIETLNNTYVQGNFYGLLQDGANPTDSLHITSGKFKVPFIR